MEALLGLISLNGIYRSLKVEPKASPKSLLFETYLAIGLCPKSEANVLFKGLVEVFS